MHVDVCFFWVVQIDDFAHDFGASFFHRLFYLVVACAIVEFNLCTQRVVIWMLQLN